jgi:1,4-alpha-glucan branching enzyme
MLRKTPWGPMPAFNNPRVRQFLIDHAVAQVLEHGFDGIRFDFTQPIYNEGGEDGRAFLRELVSQLREVAPEALLIPEDFSYQPWIVELMGSLWYTEFQHRLVHDNNPDRPGLVQAAALGKRTDVDAFLKLLTNPIGLKSLAQAITMISNHDEVGNADRTVVVAMGGAKGPPSQWARDVSRLTMMTGLMSPGIPFFFQGDESLATNGFRWGKPSTWDLGWSWLTGKGGDPAVDGPRKAASLFTRDAIALRARSDDLTADVPAKPLYSHNDDSVFAFTRGTDDAKHVVIGNVSKVDRPGYRILLPPGRWREVLNSDAVRYGGRGMTNADAVFEGEARIDLAAGGSLVLERVA